MIEKVAKRQVKQSTNSSQFCFSPWSQLAMLPSTPATPSSPGGYLSSTAGSNAAFSGAPFPPTTPTGMQRSGGFPLPTNSQGSPGNPQQISDAIFEKVLSLVAGNGDFLTPKI